MVRLKIILVLVAVLSTVTLSAQVEKKIREAYLAFEQDSQLSHAISSLYVIDATTGKVVFDKNSQVGLAGASTQKIITAATAFEMLGRDFKFGTSFWLNAGKDTILVDAGGDPTLGSDRYFSSSSYSVMKGLSATFKKNKLDPKKISLALTNSHFETNHLPGGWIWDDIGNYYGAGAYGFNWKENKSEIILSAGEKIGDPVVVKKTDSLLGKGGLLSNLKTGPANSGDNAYYYFSYGNYFSGQPELKGTIPVGEKNFPISIAVANPFAYFSNELFQNELTRQSFNVLANELSTISQLSIKKGDQLLYTHYSPSLDSVIYWFLKKSINLYGESLIKALSFQKQGLGSADSGIVLMKRFWTTKNIDENELDLYDGSGLSPMNRLTTHAQVEVLKYAKARDWFPYYFTAFPEYNGIKMKSGTINNVKGYCGYHKSKEGREFIFSFLVNNYNGRSAALVNKMYKVLDELK